jgi:hypothetical protein
LVKAKSRNSNVRLFALSDWPVALAQSANPNEEQLIHFQPARGDLQGTPWRPK